MLPPKQTQQLFPLLLFHPSSLIFTRPSPLPSAALQGGGGEVAIVEIILYKSPLSSGAPLKLMTYEENNFMKNMFIFNFHKMIFTTAPPPPHRQLTSDIDYGTSPIYDCQWYRVHELKGHM